MKFTLANVRANPFRNIEHYPYREDKVEALRESLRTTSFWDNIVGRLADDGGAEIAYGHHRLEALRREYGPAHEVELIIRELDDEHMLKIMARENMEEWGTSASIEHETVRAVVEAYAAGKVELRKSSGRVDQLRHAPSFILGDLGASHRPSAYTAATVAEFLAWHEDKVKIALGALELIQLGRVSEAQFVGLTTTQARAVVEEVRKDMQSEDLRAREQAKAAQKAQEEVERALLMRERAEAERRKREQQAAQATEIAEQRRLEAEAKRARKRAEEAERLRAKAEAERMTRDLQKREHQAQANGRALSRATQMTNSFRAGKGVNEARGEATQARAQRSTGPTVPEISQKARSVAVGLNRLFTDKDDRTDILAQLYKHRERMTDQAKTYLAEELTALVQRISVYRDMWQPTVASQTGVTDAAIVADSTVVDAEIVDAEIVDAELMEIAQ